MAEQNSAGARVARAPGSSQVNEVPSNALWMYPGQGAQVPGMCARLLATYTPANQLVSRAEEFANSPLRDVCLRGPHEKLNASEVLQPLWTALLLGCTERLKEAGLEPIAVAGHSLGEWSALAVAEVISVDDALRIAALRGALMALAAEATAGGMLAVLGLDIATVQTLVEAVRENFLVVVANDNAPQQQVVSGDLAGLEELMRRVTQVGGKSRLLDVSGAWHCPTESLIQAAEEFRSAIEKTTFRRAIVPVFLNAKGAAEVDAEVIRAAMIGQIVNPVRWRELVLESHSWGCRQFLEVGPSRVLRSLLRQILDDSNSYTVATYDGSAAPLAMTERPHTPSGGVSS